MSEHDMYTDRNYIVIEAHTPSNLQRQVHNMMVTHGFTPTGGVAAHVTAPSQLTLYLQAMVRSSEVEQQLEGQQRIIDALAAELEYLQDNRTSRPVS